MTSESAELSNLLRESKDAILARWAERVRKSVPASRTQDAPTLFNSMPDLLDLMARRVTEGAVGHYTQEVIAVPRLHGTQRAKNPAYELEHVIAEYHLIRTSIYEVVREKGETPTEDARTIINDIIDIGISIAAREFMRVQIARERLNRSYLELFNDISDLMSPPLGLLDVLDAVIAKVTVGVSATVGAILVQDPSTHAVIKSACSGANPQSAELFRSQIVSSFRPELIPAQNILVMTPGLVMKPEKIAFAAAQDFAAILGLRLVWKGNPLGILFIGFKEMRVFEPDEIERLDSLAVRLSLLIDNARLQVQSQKDIVELKEEQRTREKFVIGLVHDLRTPLTAARMVIELLRRQISEEQDPRRFGIQALANIDRVNARLGDFLDANRLKLGEPLKIKTEEFNLRGTVAEIIEELSVIHGDRFEFRSPEKLIVFWNKERVVRAVENLMENAVKYGSRDTPISIELVQNPSTVQISIHNEGSPIPKELQRELFQFHGSLEQRVGKRGWGIGLPIVYAIAEAHGGTILVESSPQAGTTFMITLPNDSRPVAERAA